jgi:hypothetical protein
MAPTARYASAGSMAAGAGVNRDPITRRASVRLDRRNANANPTALQNANARRAYTPDCEATKVETRAATPLATKALP